ncbi:glucosaminidase domain-containing protein [Actinokineospora auranticolor]|uniref:Flagellar protein FlgJ n=1 Tax=Actinokineospora auranticolor TaxID=155976 RepID=A0A2S6GBR0_9PSEU|nr:glucosaminidase domain-containing protein [Actinokineospora auranticolor]PPK61711.1 flagellar protein FlgJ [Actinokineospora auranticolor]
MRRHLVHAVGALALAACALLPAQPAGARPAVVDQAAVHEQALRTSDGEFLRTIEPIARAVAGEFRVPASVTAGQSILESSWGQSRLAVNDRNFFGFKCLGDKPGPIAIGCHDYPTSECTPDCHQVQALFRVYDSLQASFRDYGRVLSTSANYAEARPLAGDPRAFVTAVARKYATDPNYAAKVIRIMDENDLYRLDRPLP